MQSVCKWEAWTELPGRPLRRLIQGAALGLPGMKNAINLLTAFPPSLFLFYLFFDEGWEEGSDTQGYSGCRLARGPARKGNQDLKPWLGFRDSLLRSM